MNEDLNGYKLSRNWFNFAFENPDIVNPNHAAMYFFAIDHCNKLGWKTKFGFPASLVMSAMGIKSYHTYKKTLDDLVKWGFLKMVQRSKNQYTANIIALQKNNKANCKALDKATQMHSTNHPQSKDSINKPLNKETIKQRNSSVSTSGTDFPDSCKFLDEAKGLSDHLKESIIRWEPNHKYATNPPSLNSWVIEIERALRLDKRTPEELELLIDYIFTQNTHVANFWKPNIQSGKKLREKFDQVVGQIKNEINSNGTTEKTRGDKFYERLF